MDLEALFEEIKTYLQQKYHCHTIILYGSYNTGDFTEESDLDIICFADDSEDRNDVELFKGKQLDVWVYSTELMMKPDQFLRVNRGKVLLDDKGMAERFLSKINAIFNEGPKQLSEEEKDFLKSWLRKMHLRSGKNDMEGNYRFHWMLKDSLEIYFELNGQWFPGPKKAFSWLRENDPSAFALFENVLQKDSHAKDVEQLLEFLYEI
ncbi:nucleotidyltransferase domain-containing protein [Bacillus salacetis]|uniref:nucleotidyltransferase domain-containing protein n=1 Tax=Bacillus salacetis TaxID=2315464 RepID=UPI00196AF057|nr:nucleotidyltransferase domain-containing protein [Bacillus salacetis]